MTNSEPFNALIRELPPTELDYVYQAVRRVRVVDGQVIHDAGSAITNVHFPEDSLVSLLADTGDEATVDIGMIGRDGVVGVQAVLTPAPVCTHRAVVQVAGNALRMEVDAIRRSSELAPTLWARCSRYADQLLAQSSQLGACNARREIRERLARWLLMASDKLDIDALPMLQADLGKMLGVRRASLSVAAGELQRQAQSSLAEAV